MAIPNFWIENPDGNEEKEEFFVGARPVGSFNHDEHGWDGMKSARDLFESVAKAIGAKFERR